MNRDFEKLIIALLIAAGTLAAPSLINICTGASLHPADVSNVVSALLSVRFILAVMEMRARF